MFQILDGREHFYQWDIDRKIIVFDEDITEVHFCNRTDDCSLVCEVYSIDGVRLVNVPNILLQNDWRINVYAYDKNYTKHSECFKVVKRSKPTDYIYTETEIKRYGDLEERISALEEGNIDIDLDGYATQEYVDNAISNVELTPGPAGPKGEKGDKGDAGAPGKDAPQESILYISQELTEEQKAQALANLGLDELPTGGSSNVFSLAAETTEALTSFTIQLPTTFDNIYILNTHITFGTIEQTFKLYFHYGNGDWGGHNITTEMEGGSGDAVGLNIFSVRYGDKIRFAVNGLSNSYYYAALPALSGNMNGRTKAGGTKNNLWFGTNSDSLFIPAGTKFNVWGLRK